MVSLSKTFVLTSQFKLSTSKRHCVKMYRTGNVSVKEKQVSPKCMMESAPTCLAAIPSTQHSP